MIEILTHIDVVFGSNGLSHIWLVAFGARRCWIATFTLPAHHLAGCSFSRSRAEQCGQRMLEVLRRLRKRHTILRAPRSGAARFTAGKIEFHDFRVGRMG